MPKCEWCHNIYDSVCEEDCFDSMIGLGSLLQYSSIRKKLCGKCAVQAANDKVDGVFYESCEDCGRVFDWADEDARFCAHFPVENGIDLEGSWRIAGKILCADCAMFFMDSRPQGFEIY